MQSIVYAYKYDEFLRPIVSMAIRTSGALASDLKLKSKLLKNTNFDFEYDINVHKT